MRHPEYYLGRADEARTMAHATVDPKARDVLIRCAEDYEGIARQASVRPWTQRVKRPLANSPEFNTPLAT